MQAYLRGLPMLMYHKIDARHEVGINTLHPDRFRCHIKYLVQNGYQTVTFEDLLTVEKLPDRPVMLTFDDAYASVFENAFPLMREHGFRGVVFVISGFIGRQNSWDANLFNICYQHVNAAQINKLSAAGWEVGAHTVTHRALTMLGDDVARAELRQSRLTLAALTGRPVNALAYPFGLHSARIRALAREAGYAFACKIIRGSQSDDPFQLMRIPVYQFESEKDLARKLRLPISFSHRLQLVLLGLPAFLIPPFQWIFKRNLFLEK